MAFTTQEKTLVDSLLDKGASREEIHKALATSRATQKFEVTTKGASSKRTGIGRKLGQGASIALLDAATFGGIDGGVAWLLGQGKKYGKFKKNLKNAIAPDLTEGQKFGAELAGMVIPSGLTSKLISMGFKGAKVGIKGAKAANAGKVAKGADKVVDVAQLEHKSGANKLLDKPNHMKRADDFLKKEQKTTKNHKTIIPKDPTPPGVAKAKPKKLITDKSSAAIKASEKKIDELKKLRAASVKQNQVLAAKVFTKSISAEQKFLQKLKVPKVKLIDKTDRRVKAALLKNASGMTTHSPGFMRRAGDVRIKDPIPKRPTYKDKINKQADEFDAKQRQIKAQDQLSTPPRTVGESVAKGMEEANRRNFKQIAIRPKLGKVNDSSTRLKDVADMAKKGMANKFYQGADAVKNSYNKIGTKEKVGLENVLKKITNTDRKLPAVLRDAVAGGLIGQGKALELNPEHKGVTPLVVGGALSGVASFVMRGIMDKISGLPQFARRHLDEKARKGIDSNLSPYASDMNLLSGEGNTLRRKVVNFVNDQTSSKRKDRKQKIDSALQKNFYATRRSANTAYKSVELSDVENKSFRDVWNAEKATRANNTGKELRVVLAHASEGNIPARDFLGDVLLKSDDRFQDGLDAKIKKIMGSRKVISLREETTIRQNYITELFLQSDENKISAALNKVMDLGGDGTPVLSGFGKLKNLVDELEDQIMLHGLGSAKANIDNPLLSLKRQLSGLLSESRRSLRDISPEITLMTDTFQLIAYLSKLARAGYGVGDSGAIQDLKWRTTAVILDGTEHMFAHGIKSLKTAEGQTRAYTDAYLRAKSIFASSETPERIIARLDLLPEGGDKAKMIKAIKSIRGNEQLENSFTTIEKAVDEASERGVFEYLKDLNKSSDGSSWNRMGGDEQIGNTFNSGDITAVYGIEPTLKDSAGKLGVLKKMQQKSLNNKLNRYQYAPSLLDKLRELQKSRQKFAPSSPAQKFSGVVGRVTGDKEE